MVGRAKKEKQREKEMNQLVRKMLVSPLLGRREWKI